MAGPGCDLRRPEFKSGTLWYFGSDYARFLETIEADHGLEVAATGDAINAIAARIRREVINIDAQLESGLSSLSWAASDLAEANPTMSDFYLDICRALVLIEAARQGGRHIAVVDDPGLGKALVRICRLAGLTVRGEALHQSPFAAIKHAARAQFGFLRAFVMQGRALARHPFDLSKAAGQELWLMTWSDGRRGAGSGEDNDLYFGKLPEWLRAAGLGLAWIVNPVSWMNSFDAIAAAARKVTEPVALAHRFIGYRAVAQAYLTLAALPFAVRRHLRLGGFDLSPLVRRAVRREFTTSRLLGAAVYAGLAAGLKRSHIRPKLVLYTCENQPWEKCMLLGFRRELPETQMIGVQHTPMAENYLSGQHSDKQWAGDSAPDLLLTIGREFYDRLVASGVSSDRLHVGGALRFDDMLRIPPDDSGRTDKSSFWVLAACPLDRRDCFDLVHKAVMSTAGLDGVQLAVNFHPMLSMTTRREIEQWEALRGKCSHVRFVEGNALEWLKQASLLLYNSSSTVFEATALGVSAIHIGSSLGIDIDKVPGGAVTTHRSVESLRQDIKEILAHPTLRHARVEAARTAFQRCLAAPNSELWIGLARSALRNKPHEPGVGGAGLMLSSHQ